MYCNIDRLTIKFEVGALDSYHISTCHNSSVFSNRILLCSHFFVFCCCFFQFCHLVISSPQSNEVLGTQLVALESEKAELVQSLSKVEAELAVRGEELERVQSSLATERESGVKAAEALQNQLNEKVKNFRHLHST